jgi:hypothetical protein
LRSWRAFDYADISCPRSMSGAGLPEQRGIV